MSHPIREKHISLMIATHKIRDAYHSSLTNLVNAGCGYITAVQAHAQAVQREQLRKIDRAYTSYTMVSGFFSPQISHFFDNFEVKYTGKSGKYKREDSLGFGGSLVCF